MSDRTPGPGWWLASDGRWYAPELLTRHQPVPRRGPPQGPPSYPPRPTDHPFHAPLYPASYSAQPFPLGWQRRPTNGLAIASMVLGILWIGWVGSILAVVFGYLALVQVRVRNENGRGMAIAGVVLGWIGIGLGAVVLVFALTFANTPDRFARLPNPLHPVAGKPITLPPALYLTSPPESSSLFTPVLANTVGETMWKLWETALVDRDTTALTQLVAAGPVLTSELNECAWPTGGCVVQTRPRPILSIQSVVPVQTSYPLHFLTQIRTTEYLGEENGPPKLSSWVELQILTKASPVAPWQLSFDTGYNGVTNQVPLTPFDEEADGSVGADTDVASFNPSPARQGPIAASEFLPTLADYWQSWKETGAAPRQSVVAAGGDTSGFGEQLARSPEGSVFDGIEQRYRYQAYPEAGSWTFSANGGYPMVCGTISVVLTSTPAGGGHLNQNFDRTNWGMTLVPGQYSRIVTEDTHQTCVFVEGDQLAASGGPTDNPLEVTGTPAH